MSQEIRIFMLLMRKNIIIRKRHWIQSLVLQIFIPICLTLFTLVVPLLINEHTQYVSSDTYDQRESEDSLMANVSDALNVKYTPSNAITDKIMEDTRVCLGLSTDRVVATSNENTMVNDFLHEEATMSCMNGCVGIVFQSLSDNDTLPKLFKYKLRISAKAPPFLFSPEANSDAANYEFHQVSTVQVPMCLDKSYIKLVEPNPRFKTDISIQQMPYPPYLQAHRDVTDVGKRLGYLARLAFLIILCVEITLPADEKYIGMNILMTVNGVSNRLNLLSWLVSGVIWSMSYLIPIVLILKYFMPPLVLPFLLYGDVLLVWVTLFIHVCHLLAFGLHLSAYFWKPSRGIFATVMTMLLMDIFVYPLEGFTAERIRMYMGIFSPNCLLERTFYEITSYENNLYGIQWSNLFTSASTSIPEGSIGFVMVFSIIGILLHFFMAIYIYAIRPGKYGVPRHPFYCFQKRRRYSIHDERHMMDFHHRQPTKKEFEYVEPGSLQSCMEIRGLRKVYTTDWLCHTKVNALRGVSMDIYKNQITALLGHNGAGKTTMMSILAGLTDASEGVAFIDGKNILNQTNIINNNIGLCPQENMLFPDLTAHQQLMLFGMIKANNRTKLQLENEVRTLLVKVNLTDKTNNYPSQLSGGQKRRLCLAMAIIGGAKVVILDEPTSGMDVESKREVWDILLKMRSENTIIVSTHDMEEADILGDKIAIMHAGELRSYGTSMYLKKLYGNGEIEVKLSIEPWCNISNISKAIGITAHILNQDNGKIVFALPPTESLPEALDKLENSKEQLGITGMSVSIITLEQAFLRITKDDCDEQNSDNNIEAFEKITGLSYYLQTFFAFFTRKVIFAWKNQWSFLISIFLPCISVMILLLKFGRRSNFNDPFVVSLSAYPHAKAFVHSDRSILSNMYLNTVESFGGSALAINTNTSITDSLLNYRENNAGAYRNRVIVSAEFNDTSDGHVTANGFYSGTAVLGIPTTINCITNAIVKALTNDEEYKIEMSMQSLPQQQKLNEDYNGIASTLVMSLIVILSPAIALYVIQPLSETLSGIKELQAMTGAPKLMYWAATFLFDLMQYLVSILLLIGLFIATDILLETQLYHETEICITLVLFFLFGMSTLPLVYLSTFFKRSSNATTMVLTIAPIILVSMQLILYIVALNPSSGENYQLFWEIQSKVFLLVPHLSFTFGHLSFFDTLVRNARCRHMSEESLAVAIANYDECLLQFCDNHVCELPLSYTEPKKYIPDLHATFLWLGISSIFYFCLIFILEQQYLTRMVAMIRGNKPIPDQSGIDEKVKKELHIVNEEIAKRINNHDSKYHDNENIFLVQGLKKNYGNLHAVKGISFRVKESECFGLLGVNGAGKSTTFKMLSGGIIPNNGTIYLKQYNNSLDRLNYLSSLGYCPQQDAIISTLNSWDHLYLFARLRGIPPSQVPTIVQQWVTKLNLTPCAFQASGTYSGGNKRRLNIALALIGNPPLVLMDEPTTGVDPAARRSLWNTLKSCQKAGQSIILSSHSMEECEVLCNRLVIIVGGEIVCVGASEQLKQRFGAGYNIHVKLSSTQRVSDVEQIKQRIVSTLNCNLIDQNTGFLGYHVVDRDTTWTNMYTLMNNLKKEYGCIEDYVIFSSTLEQLFIQFARSSNKRNDRHNHSNGAVVKESWKPIGDELPIWRTITNNNIY